MLKSIASRSSYSLGRQLATQPNNIAALERYGAIRSFFRQQSFAPNLSPISSHGTQKRYAHTVFRAQDASQKSRAPLTRPTYILITTRLFTTCQPPQKHSCGRQETEKRSDDSTTDPHKDEMPSAENPFPYARDHENYSRFFQRLALSLPHLHRPTRDDFLNVATGFWQRLRIRFKWFTVRGFRKFNADDISAFITWFLMSQTLWILIGTYVNLLNEQVNLSNFFASSRTTFFSVIFSTANSLRLQREVPVLRAQDLFADVINRLCCEGYQRLSDI